MSSTNVKIYIYIYIYIYILCMYMYNGTQSIKANVYQLAKSDTCEYKSKVQAKKYDKF